MGESSKGAKTMGQKQDFEENKEDNESQEPDGRKFEPTTMRKNLSDGLLTAREDPDLINGNRPKSEILLKKNPRIACVAIEIDPGTDDDECNKNNNQSTDPENENQHNDDDEEANLISPSKVQVALKRQTNVKEDFTESNGNLSSIDFSNKKRKLQKQPNIENLSPTDIPNNLSIHPSNSIRDRLTGLLSANRKKPLKSYSCPQDYDCDRNKILERQCMSLDEECKVPSTMDETQPTVRHRPFCLKSSLKGEDNPSHNHVQPQKQQSPIHSPKKPGVKIMLDDVEGLSNRERRSIVYSRKNSLMPQVT